MGRRTNLLSSSLEYCPVQGEFGAVAVGTRLRRGSNTCFRVYSHDGTGEAASSAAVKEGSRKS